MNFLSGADGRIASITRQTPRKSTPTSRPPTEPLYFKLRRLNELFRHNDVPIRYKKQFEIKSERKNIQPAAALLKSCNIQVIDTLPLPLFLPSDSFFAHSLHVTQKSRKSVFSMVDKEQDLLESFK
jgi:hypothetical protein